MMPHAPHASTRLGTGRTKPGTEYKACLSRTGRQVRHGTHASRPTSSKATRGRSKNPSLTASQANERFGGQMTLQRSKRRSDWTKKKSLADSLSRGMVESVSHLTQAAAARRLGVSGSSICRLRKKYVVPVQKVRTRRDSVRSHRVWEEEEIADLLSFRVLRCPQTPGEDVSTSMTLRDSTGSR
ncbi:hypothetical protein HKI87_09g58920 [Chloropicon roscoffensis]|uniref:Transposase Tc1-like domain-containing protein n=1 Tax=Chloropicon roscoffensis TaxID=1461544 RepID=A0AAX4PF11_9CHLO